MALKLPNPGGVLDYNTTLDGFVALDGGMDSGRPASEIDDTKFAYAINCTCRGGPMTHRPAFRRVELAVPQRNPVEPEARRYDRERWFKAKNVQNALGYQPANILSSQEGIVASVGGRIFQICLDGGRGTVVEITPYTNTGASQDENVLPLDPNPAVIPWVCLSQSSDYALVQDGQSAALIFDGSICRRARNTPAVPADPDAGTDAVPEDREVPIGTFVTYGMGRTIVARNQTWLAGDLIYESQADAILDVLKFNDTQYLASGQDFALPANAGNITGLIFTNMTDTATGQGELLIGTRSMIVSANLLLPRDQWQDNFTQRIALIANGPVSHGSLVHVNGDIWYRAVDGIRSYTMSSRRESASRANVPMSREVNAILQHDSQALLSYANAVYFDNRLLMTCWPKWDSTTQSYSFAGVIALDFDPASILGGGERMAYDGIWQWPDGVSPIVLTTLTVAGEERCFALCRNATSNENELWEILRGGRDDFDLSGNVPIRWQFDTKAYSGAVEAGSGPFVLKELKAGELFLDQMSGAVTLDVSYRPDDFPCFNPWLTIQENAEVCETVPSCPPLNKQPQYRTRHLLTAPDYVENCVAGYPMAQGYTHAFRFAVTGSCRIKRFRYSADNKPMQPQGDPAVPADYGSGA